MSKINHLLDDAGVQRERALTAARAMSRALIGW